MVCHVQSGDLPAREFGNPLPCSLSAIVGAFKSASTRLINLERNTPGAPVWQRGFHEHVVRDEFDLSNAQEYIVNNPLKWNLDKYYSP
jgi:hypothetical protein